jgi:hypothetical protein
MTSPGVSGTIDPLKAVMLQAFMTRDKFKDPLEKLHLIQEASGRAEQNMINQGINPRLAQIMADRMTDEVSDQAGVESPADASWRYGQAPENLDDLFSEKQELAFKSGGFVAPLQMAAGGAMPLPLLAKTGGALPRGDGRLDFRHGAHVAGEGDGQSDDIKAMLADGEFVFPADVVSALGNGSTKAGSDKLYEMMHSIRSRARSKGPKDLPPPALKSPLDYLKKR